MREGSDDDSNDKPRDDRFRDVHDVDDRAETSPAASRAGREGMPRWVKLFVLVTAVLILLVVIVMLVGGGQHGPGRHLSSGSASISAGLLAAASFTV